MIGVVSHFKFATPDNRKYQGYIKYMARDEAKRTTVYQDETNFAMDDLDYDTYNRYMSNPEKTSGLFDRDFNQMSQKEVRNLRKQFQIAQAADSNMWQIVVSFDNQWLEKFGAYKPETHELDELVVMNAARNGMAEVLKSADMEQAVWSGAIHYNTDNIHVHLAIVETHPSKSKRWYQDKKTGEWGYARPGYLPYQAINRLKSQVANTIAGRSQEHAKFDALIRQKIGNQSDLKAHLHDSFQMHKLYQDLYAVLPSDKRLWKYNNHAMADYRGQIDRISHYYIEHFHAEEFQEFRELLSVERDFIKETYGDGKRTQGRFLDYEQGKMNELYSRLGNAILKDLSVYDREQRALSPHSKARRLAYEQRPRVDFRALRQTFKKTYEETKRQREFEQLQWEIEQEL